MERVEAERRAGALLGDNVLDERRGVGAHELDVLASLGAELVEELPQRRLVLAGHRPEQPPGVVVDDDRHVAVPLAVARLVDADASHVREAVDELAAFGADPFDDAADRAPRHAQQRRHGGLVGAHDEPRDVVLERPRERRAVPRPRDSSDDHGMRWACHTRSEGLDERLHDAQVQGTPAAHPIARVEPRASAMAVWASAQQAPPRMDPDHHELLVAVLPALDVLDDGVSLDAEQPRPYARSVHPALLVRPLVSTTRIVREARGARSSATEFRPTGPAGEPETYAPPRYAFVGSG